MAVSQPGLAPSAVAAAPKKRTAVILAINDVYRLQGLENGHLGGLARVAALAEELRATYGRDSVVILHAGDFLFPSLLSGPADPEGAADSGKGMIEILNLLVPESDDRLVAVFGNHEFDRGKCESAAELKRRIDESKFVWLKTNVVFGSKDPGKPCDSTAELRADPRLASNQLLQVGGISLGVFGLTIGDGHPDYVHHFDGPIATAVRQSDELRAKGAEVVVGLTHLAAAEDRALLETLGPDGPNLIVGGHDHERMTIDVARTRDGHRPSNQQANGAAVWPVYKADADARTASVIALTVIESDGKPPELHIDQQFRDLVGELPRKDPAVEAEVKTILDEHEKRFCPKIGEKVPCLGAKLATAGVDVVGDEGPMRSAETALGNWIADLIRTQCDADVAFINSGAIRLNETIRAGRAIQRRHVEDAFRYPSPLMRFDIDGATLRRVLDYAVTEWPGSGHWLQVSGFAFTHLHQEGTPAPDRVLALTRGPGAGSPVIAPGERLRVATIEYLARGNDGFDMLAGVTPEPCPRNSELKRLVLETLRSAEELMLPSVNGRIRLSSASEAPGASYPAASVTHTNARQRSKWCAPAPLIATAVLLTVLVGLALLFCQQRRALAKLEAQLKEQERNTLVTAVLDKKILWGPVEIDVTGSSVPVKGERAEVSDDYVIVTKSDGTREYINKGLVECIRQLDA